MNNLSKIKADNATRRALKDATSNGPWTIYTSIWGIPNRQFVAAAKNDNVEDVVDALVTEIEQLRVELTLPHIVYEGEN